MNEVAKEWVDKAEEDFDSADLLLHAGETPLSSPACFHCQQCAEKYLKAFLTDHLIRFERTHRLVDLLGLCIPVDKDFRKLAGDLNSLEGLQSPYGILAPQFQRILRKTHSQRRKECAFL